jgi:phage baseplate assembly protein W
MPIIQNTKKINPLDINNNIRIGLAFPLNSVNMTTGTISTKDQIKSNFLNLLLTVPGERINQPNYGVGLKSRLFENTLDESTLLEDINAQTSFYMPEISIDSINVKQDVDEYKITISLSYSINDQSEDSIQINFS